MASEDVTWGDRWESETLASTAESRVSSDCGLWEETEEAVFSDLRRYILSIMTLSDLYDLQPSDEIIIIITIILIPQFPSHDFTYTVKYVSKHDLPILNPSPYAVTI